MDRVSDVERKAPPKAALSDGGRPVRSGRGVAPSVDWLDTAPRHDHRRNHRGRQYRFIPNYIPFGERLVAAVATMTWVAWALVGFLSGHMFFLVSRRGPLHFAGVPALLFSAAVLVSAAALASTILDHYDRRDNERAYRRAKRMLWGAAGIFFLLSVLVAMAEWRSLLPWTDGSVGLLSSTSVRALLTSEALASALRPHRSWLSSCFVATTIWFMVGTAVSEKVGWLSRDQAVSLELGQRHPLRTALVLSVLVLPGLTCFLFVLLTEISWGELFLQPAATEHQVRSRVAWAHSMLIGCVGALLFVLSAVITFVLRHLRVIPSLSEELARKSRAVH